MRHTFFKNRFSGICRDSAIYSGCSEQAIAMQIQENALEQMLEVEDAIASALENLDLVVETFHKATILALDKKVGDLLPPCLEQVQEQVETL